MGRRITSGNTCSFQQTVQSGPVKFPYPGRRIKHARRISNSVALILLTMLGFAAAVPLPPNNLSNTNLATSDSTSASGSQPVLPNRVVAGHVPSLSLPKTIVSNVANLTSTSGITQDSGQNLTIYNSGVKLRLLGGSMPHDELLGPDNEVLSRWSFWSVQILVGHSWRSIIPVSSNFTIPAATTGTVVVRTMSLGLGNFSGVFRMVYRASSAGSLKWDLQFLPGFSGKYRLVYEWSNITMSANLHSATRQFEVGYPQGNYMLSWDDVSKSYNVTNSAVGSTFALAIDLGALGPTASVLIDPSITSSSSWATSYSFQRKVFYEPSGGYYFIFYFDGTRAEYSSSSDGVTWSSPNVTPLLQQIQNMQPYPWDFSVASSGRTVVVADSERCGDNSCNPHWATVYYSIGTITGPNISWGPKTAATSFSPDCYNGFPASCGIRYVNVGMSSTGYLAISFNYFDTTNAGSSFSDLFVWNMKSSNLRAFVDGLIGKQIDIPSSIVPDDAQGNMTVVYQIWSPSTSTVQMISRCVSASDNVCPWVLIDGNNPSRLRDFSAVSDAKYGVHAIWRNDNDGTISYSYQATSSQNWTPPSRDILSGSADSPVLTVDYANNDVYAFGIQGSSVTMKHKSSIYGWSDSSLAAPITNKLARTLGSNYASTSGTTNSKLLLVWTEGTSSPFKVTFASIPIQTVWSPYSSPADPWDGNGIAPYGQYFSNLGESVSASSGMLTIRQTDLSLAGRGLDFSFTRVYTEPLSFLNGNPYNYDSSYGFRDETFTTGWTNSDRYGTFSSNGDVVTITVTSTPSGSPAISKSISIDTSIYRYLVWRVQGTHAYQVGVWVGNVLYKFSPSIDPSAPSSWTTVAWDVGAATGGALVNSVVLWAVGNTGDVDQYDYVGFTRSTVGNGWQLNFPWIGIGAHPQFIHLSDGQGYRIPSNFWTNSTPSSFENHQGEHFRIVRNPDNSIVLYAKSGVYFVFDNTPTHKLQSINQQATATNAINFTYDGSNRLSSMTDTVGRIFLLYYNSTYPMLLQSINETLISGTGSARGVVYKYDSKLSLIAEIDPAGRVTSYSYQSTIGVGPFLLARITYPTSWYDSYQYSPYTIDTTVLGTTYRVSEQLLNMTSGSPVRRNEYIFTSGPGEQITGATINVYDSSQFRIGPLQTSTQYSYSFPGVSWTIFDASGQFVRGYQQSFGMHGEVTAETVFLGPGIGYVNYYNYDAWGNQIYSRTAISNGSSHQRFMAYSNNGLPPSFYAFADTFSLNQGTSSDNPWSVKGGYWNVNGGSYTGIETTGNEEDDLASADIGVADISLQSQVYINKLVNMTAGYDKVGIFAHYNAGSSLAYKWALVLAGSGTGKFIGLVDEYNQWVAQATCNWGSTGAWYTFNMTIHGLNALGTVNGGGISCTVNGTFPPGSPAWGGTRFGLYAGGYSAMFKNVLVGTVNSYITTTGFSNGFTTTAIPGPTIHSAIAGIAELQNGPGRNLIETYYGYNSWGGMTDEWRRLDYPYAQRIHSTQQYDTFGNVVTSVNPDQNVTYYNYDTTYGSAYLTKRTQILNPGNLRVTTLFTYNFTMGNVLSNTDPNGQMTTYQYDILGRTRRIVYPTGDYVSYAYNDHYSSFDGQASSVDISNENGVTSRQIYDGLGRLDIDERHSVPTVNAIFYSYNWMDKVATKLIFPGAITYSYQYDALGRLLVATKPDHTTTSQTYNDANSWIVYTDEAGNHRCNNYDWLSRLISVTEYSGSDCAALLIAGWQYVSNYGYDEVGNLLSVVNARGYYTTYAYDNLNRAISISNPDGTFQSSSYDRTGNVISTIDRNNVASLYSYDSLGRLQTATHCGATVISESYTYDKAGNTIASQNQNATITYGYDARNRILNETYTANPSTRSVVNLGCPGSPGTWTVTGGQTNTDTISFTYNGELTNTIVYPGVKALYAYDGFGRPVSVQHASTGVYFATVSYDPYDRVKGIQYGNGLVGNYTYDNLGRYSTITLANGGTTMMSLAYNYNTTGTVASVIGQVNQGPVNEQYRYDPLGRLTNATVVSGGATTNLGYQYDNVGNRISQTLSGVVTSYAYNYQNNELSSSSTPGISTTFSYDANGNLRSKAVTTGGTVNWAYSWDAANHLLSATNSTGQAQYAYDSSGRKIEAVESGSTSFFVYQGTEVLHKRLLNSDKFAYIYISGFRVSMVISGSSRYYFHTDALGSTRMMTWQNAGMVYVDNYQPFGQDSGSPQGSFASRAVDKFTGKPLSTTTGLYYHYHRWYDPSIGRFISPDPKQGKLSNPQSLNLYIYVLNLPTSLTDPSGLDWWNPLSWTPQQQAQAFTIAVIVLSVVAVVATAGLAAPIAGAVIGAAIGASTSSAVYTITAGDKATLAGAALNAAVGGLSGAIGGGAGGLAANFVRTGGSLLIGMGAAGLGQAAGNLGGNFVGSLVSGQKFQFDPVSFGIDAGVGALTFGGGEKFVNPRIGNFVASKLMSRDYLPSGSASKISTLVGSIFDSDAHPRAFYQETTGLIESGIDAAEAFASQMFGIPRSY